MKLRQKLAVVLASAMVMTAMPVVTMADSVNTLVKETTVVNEDHIFANSSNAPYIKVKLSDYDTDSSKNEVFYLTLDNAEWHYNANTKQLIDGDGEWKATNVAVQVMSKKVLKVTVNTGLGAEPIVRIPLLTQVDSGDAVVTVDPMGGHSSVTKGSYLFATTGDEVGTVSVDETTNLYTNGTIGDILITEDMVGAFNKGTQIELTLNNDEFIFVDADQIKTNLEYGFSNHSSTYIDADGKEVPYVTAKIKSGDKQVLVINIAPGLVGDSKGQIRLEGIKVKSTEKAPQTGDLTLTVEGDDINEISELTVAKIANYGTEITVEEVADIKAGTTEEVEFTLEEKVDDSITSGRYIDFTLNQGYFALEGKDDAETLAALKSAIKTLELNDSEKGIKITDFETNDDDEVIGFTVEVEATDDIDEINVKANVTADLETKGDITVKASGHGVAGEASAVIAVVKQPVTVTAEEAVLKVGLKGQTAGKITLTETEAGMLKSGKKLEVYLENASGITIAEEPTVKVTEGDLSIGEVEVEDVTNANGKVTGTKVVIEVKRASKSASTVEIKDFQMDTDRTVPQGSYDIELAGTALTELEDDSLTVEDFVVISTANTEDIIGSNGLVKGTSTFVIGESKYTMNGASVEMDAASYIQNPGYTMIPVRYVAEAFGVAKSDILFSDGTVTIFAGTRTIQLKNNSAIATVNGTPITMGTKIVIKEGRTYAPVGEIARLLGISTAWDNTTKTATFTNK